MSLVLLVLKITFDCLARIILIGTWLYVQDEGRFSASKTVIVYYSTFIVLFLCNIFFSKRKEKMTRRNITGI